MIKILGRKLSILLFTGVTLYGGSIESSVDSTEIERGDSVLFSLTIVGEESDPLPNMTEIDGIKIDKITHHQGSDLVYVDGKSVMQHTSTITYEFKPPYNMTIPAFQVMVDGKSEISKAINLKIVKPTVGGKKKNKYFSLEMKLNKKEAYVGEPVVATVYFMENKNIHLMELDYKKPPFSAFFSKQLEGENTYKDGIYTVHKLNYLLLPKHEGNISVEPATARVAQRVEELQEGGWFANVPKWSNIASSVHFLNVKKSSEAYDIGGDFSLNSSVDTEHVKANKPVNLKIELQGEGDLEAFEGIDFQLPNVTIYSDDAKVKSEFKSDKLQSHYVKSFAFIADHDFTIPSKTIRVFNYKTGKVTLLKTKEYAIKVEGTREKEVVPMAVVHTNKAVAPKRKLEVQSLSESLLERLRNLPPTALLLGLTFLLGMMSSFFLLYLFKLFSAKRKRKKQAFNGHEALQILYPHMSESREVEEMVRQLYAIKNGERRIKIDKEQLKKLLNIYKPDTKA